MPYSPLAAASGGEGLRRGVLGLQPLEDLHPGWGNGMFCEVVALVHEAAHLPVFALDEPQDAARERASPLQGAGGVVGLEPVPPGARRGLRRSQGPHACLPFAHGVAQAGRRRGLRIEEAEQRPVGQRLDRRCIARPGDGPGQGVLLSQRDPVLAAGRGEAVQQPDAAAQPLFEERARPFHGGQARRERREGMTRVHPVRTRVTEGTLQRGDRIGALDPHAVGGESVLVLRREVRHAAGQRDDAHEQRAQGHARVRGQGAHGRVESGHRPCLAIEPGQRGLPLRFPGRGRAGRTLERALVGRLQVEDELPLVCLRIVDQADEVVQAALPQPVVHDVDGRALLAHEEDPLPLGQQVGHEIGDRLGLPGARRPLDDVAAAGLGGGQGAELGRIAEHDRITRGEIDVRHLEVRWPRCQRKDRLEGAARLVAGDEAVVVADERHLAVVEVSEGEVAKVEIPGVRVAGVGAALTEGDERLLLLHTLARIVRRCGIRIRRRSGRTGRGRGHARAVHGLLAQDVLQSRR
jgi:hypothetical protein